MRITPSQVVLALHLISASIFTKEFKLVPFVLLFLLLLLDSKIRQEIRGILYVLVALSTMPSLLAIFIFYLPFCLFGLVFPDQSFIKKYLFGYAISLFLAAAIYITSIIFPKINIITILTIYYLPVALLILRLVWKKETARIFGAFRLENKEALAAILTFGFLFCLAGFIVNGENLYNSNGTYVYSKFFTVFDSISESGKIPQYDPRIGQGEQLFLSDTPTFYTALASLNAILKIEPVAFFNAMTFFIIWLSALGAFVFISRLIDADNSYKSFAISTIGAMSIVYSFTFFQFFESFKQSATYPYNFLALALVFSLTWHPREIFAIAICLLASFLTHPTKAAGVILIAAWSMFFLFIDKGPRHKLRNFWSHFKANKLLIILVILSLLLIPLFYLYPGIHFKSFARDANFPGFSKIDFTIYFKELFLDKNNNPVTYSYPDLKRLDQKRFGFFFSSIGIFSIAAILAGFRNSNYWKARVFIFAYAAHFLISSVIVYIPPFPQAEYGYRTAIPFLLVLFVACACAFIYSIKKRELSAVLLLVFFAGFAHSAYYAKENMKNIHSESVISSTFSDEKNFVMQLPVDGRFMTLGMYSNAIDMAFSVQTDHYFSRYGYLQWDFSDNIYNKITTMNSFGVTETIEPMSGDEFSNYLRLGGYKYAFLNICHPVGNLALQKLYPQNAYPIFQNPSYQCMVMLGINNSNYAEKVKILEHVNESVYKNPNGYWHVSFNRNKKIHGFDLSPHLENVAKDPVVPIPLSFRRIDFENVEIYGNFEKDDWVVFKEEYFPRWKAKMNGKEVPLLATNNRMLLIRADPGDKIELSYGMLKEEKTAASVSIIALIIFLAALILIL